MNLTTASLVHHFTKLVTKNVENVLVEGDGSYVAASADNSVIISAPPLEGYTVSRSVVLFDIPLFLKIIKTMKTEGGVNLNVADNGMTMELSNGAISYTYALGDESETGGLVNGKKMKKILKGFTFDNTFTLTSSVIKDVLQALGTLGGEKVLLAKSEDGLNILLGSKLMHHGKISVTGDSPLHVDSLAIPSDVTQEVLKNLANNEKIILAVDETGCNVRFSTDDDYLFYISKCDDIAGYGA